MSKYPFIIQEASLLPSKQCLHIWQKVILPIRGFKGNRVLYGDSLDAVGEVTEDEDEDEDEEAAEPLYAEPQFLAPCAGSPVSSDTSSGRLSHQVLLQTKVHEVFIITEKDPTRAFS